MSDVVKKDINLIRSILALSVCLRCIFMNIDIETSAYLSGCSYDVNIEIPSPYDTIVASLDEQLQCDLFSNLL